MLKKIILGLLITAAISGCIKNSGTSYTCNFDPCSIHTPDSQITAVKNYLESKNITATQHCSGLFYSIEDPGTGNTPTACSNVLVKYVGKFTNDSTFDHSDSAIFNLSVVIPGWTIGIPLVKPGGKIHLYVPPYLAYGQQNYMSIPGNSILVFDVDLIAAQ